MEARRQVKGQWTQKVGLLMMAAVIGGGIPGVEGWGRLRAEEPEASGGVRGKRWALEECLSTAMAGNRRRPASRFALAMAEAQHRQALSGYWPQVHLKAAYLRMDESPNFVFPAGMMMIPSQTVAVPGGVASVTVPANAFGPGFPPAELQMPVAFPGQTLQTPAQVFPIPEQDVTLMDPNSVTASMNLTWLLYDGGMRRGLREQAKAGVEAARQEVRRTELEIQDDVRRMYYGAVLARQVLGVGAETLERMQATLSLTETLYKEGAGTVKKTDYLDNRVMVESLRSAVAMLEKNAEMAEVALAYSMGLSWRERVVPAEGEIPFEGGPADVVGMVDTAYQFSPDWEKLNAGLKAAEGALRTARSGHYPKVALTGELHRWWNEMEGGLSTTENREGWSAGVGMEIPLFDGFLTRQRVAEARAKLDQMREQQVLLREGIGIQVRDLLLSLGATAKSMDASREAMGAAAESRDLNTRAYQNELVETEKVIRAQLLEALMTAQHLKVRFDHVALRSRLNLVVGTEVWRQLTKP